MAGRAALDVAAEAGEFLRRGVVERIEQVPGVKAAVPSRAKIRRPAGTRRPMSACWPWASIRRSDEAVRDYELEEGQFFQEKYDALLETGFARGLGIERWRRSEAGRHARHARGSIKTFKITGLLSPRRRRFQPRGRHLSAAENGRTCFPRRATSI